MKLNGIALQQGTVTDGEELVRNSQPDEVWREAEKDGWFEEDIDCDSVESSMHDEDEEYYQYRRPVLGQIYDEEGFPVEENRH